MTRTIDTDGLCDRCESGDTIAVCAAFEPRDGVEIVKEEDKQ